MIFIDFESHTSGKYRLGGSGLTVENYVRDPRFQPTLLSLAENDGEPISAAGPDAIEVLLASRDWSRETMVMHNAQFDAAILAFHYGLVPRFILDTLCIARATFGLTENVGLGDLAARFGLEQKCAPYAEIDGKRLEDTQKRADLDRLDDATVRRADDLW